MLTIQHRAKDILLPTFILRKPISCLVEYLAKGIMNSLFMIHVSYNEDKNAFTPFIERYSFCFIVRNSWNMIDSKSKGPIARCYHTAWFDRKLCMFNLS